MTASDDNAGKTIEITDSAGVEVTDSTDAVVEPGDDASAAPADADTETAAADAEAAKHSRRRGGFGKSRRLAYVVLPALAILLAGATAFLVWQDISASAVERARVDSTQAAKDSTQRMLSYNPDTVEADLTAARDLITDGTFKNEYTKLTNEVVIPGAKEKKIAAVANVPAIASVEASKNHAVALVFVNQTVTEGDGVPTATASSVQVTLEKVDGRWLISAFDPV